MHDVERDRPSGKDDDTCHEQEQRTDDQQSCSARFRFRLVRPVALPATLGVFILGWIECHRSLPGWCLLTFHASRASVKHRRLTLSLGFSREHIQPHPVSIAVEPPCVRSNTRPTDDGNGARWELGRERGEGGKIGADARRITPAQCHSSGSELPRGSRDLVHRQIGSQIVDAPSALLYPREGTEELPTRAARRGDSRRRVADRLPWEAGGRS